MSSLGGFATRIGGSPADARVLGRRERAWARISAALWPPARGVAELRWGAVTLGIMATLGVVATIIDPVEGEWIRLVAVTIPTGVVLAVAGWGPAAARIGASRRIRRSLGPLVLAVAAMGTGTIDLTTLAMPSVAPVMVLALAYAAMTPGFAFAAAVMAGVSLGILIAHWEVTRGLAVGPDPTDEFVVRSVVILIAAAGMAGLLHVATKAEERATMLAAQRRERLDVLETLNGIIARFDGTLPTLSVMQDVVDDIAREFEIALVSMWLPVGRDRLTLVGVAGYPAPFIELEVGVGIIGRAAATLQTQFVPDVLADPDYRAARDDVRSEVAAPIVHTGKLLGVVNFEGTLERPIGTAQVAIAEMVVHALSAALRSARFDDERRDRLHAIERVLAVSRSLVADLDRARIVDSIVDTVAELLTAEVVALFSRRADGSYRLEAATGFPERAIDMELPGREGMVGRAIGERAQMEGLHDVSAWPPAYLADRPGGEDPHAAMALPIEVGGSVAAVLFVARVGADRTYSEVERAIADLLTAQIAIALQNADLHARVADSALRDPLTGLLNRRFFDEAVETAYANARRAGTELSLIVLDLDRFSAVNNEHGHAVGDAVLRRIARAIKRAIRDGDVVVRYGGEEFVVIAPATDGDGAVRAAERIRESVAASASELVDGRLVPLTISAGVASLVDESDGRGLFRAADSALLAAKRAGRDRVTKI
jgi:diguanylate cyclase (GGDEF)-like protein